MSRRPAIPKNQIQFEDLPEIQSEFKATLGSILKLSLNINRELGIHLSGRALVHHE